MRPALKSALSSIRADARGVMVLNTAGPPSSDALLCLIARFGRPLPPEPTEAPELLLLLLLLLLLPYLPLPPPPIVAAPSMSSKVKACPPWPELKGPLADELLFEPGVPRSLPPPPLPPPPPPLNAPPPPRFVGVLPMAARTPQSSSSKDAPGSSTKDMFAPAVYSSRLDRPKPPPLTVVDSSAFIAVAHRSPTPSVAATAAAAEPDDAEDPDDDDRGGRDEPPTAVAAAAAAAAAAAEVPPPPEARAQASFGERRNSP